MSCACQHIPPGSLGLSPFEFFSELDQARSEQQAAIPLAFPDIPHQWLELFVAQVNELLNFDLVAADLIGPKVREAVVDMVVRDQGVAALEHPTVKVALVLVDDWINLHDTGGFFEHLKKGSTVIVSTVAGFLTGGPVGASVAFVGSAQAAGSFNPPFTPSQQAMAEIEMIYRQASEDLALTDQELAVAGQDAGPGNLTTTGGVQQAGFSTSQLLKAGGIAVGAGLLAFLVSKLIMN